MTSHDTGTNDTASPKAGSPGTPPSDDELRAARADFKRASGSLQGALRRLHENEDEAWRDYAADVDDTIARMEADLAISEARLRADRAETKQELEQALDEVTLAWRQRADEIRVQTKLGEMDARDHGLVALADLEAAGHRLATLVETVRHDATEWTSALRTHAGELIGDVRGAVAGLVLVARPDDDDADPSA